MLVIDEISEVHDKMLTVANWCVTNEKAKLMIRKLCAPNMTAPCAFAPAGPSLDTPLRLDLSTTLTGKLY